MKPFFRLIVAVFLVGCSNSTEELDSTISTAGFSGRSSSQEAKEKVVIYSDEFDTIAYSSDELKQILKKYPQLTDKYWLDPETVYETRLCSGSASGEDDFTFGSEVGKDNFFIIYGYFLRKHNGEKEHEAQRLRLIDIFRTINDINGMLDYGGTYYGHQYKRIIGYVEFAIYSQVGNDFYDVKYDYTRQKDLYLDLFRQTIRDKISVDNETLGKEKVEREQALLSQVDKLGTLIGDYSNLFWAERFHYSNY